MFKTLYFFLTLPHEGFKIPTQGIPTPTPTLSSSPLQIVGMWTMKKVVYTERRKELSNMFQKYYIDYNYY
jgi:hypothetical protein